MAIDDLIRALESEGQFDSEGHFTLDREKAREKTRKFQLAEPLYYLLELVQAAIGRGATQLDFRIDTDDMWLEYDGEPWAHDDIDSLYDALLSSRAALELRRSLAIGLNSAMALRPAHIRLESGAVRLEMRPDQPDVFGPLSPPRAGTRIHVRDQFSVVQVLAFFRTLFGQAAGVALLRARCGHAQVPIVINGQAIEPARADALRYETPFHHAHGTGVVGFDPQAAEGALLIITHGVWITRTPQPTPGLVARVHAKGLTKDASRFQFVQDAAWTALQTAIGTAQDEATAAAVESMIHDAAPSDDWRRHMAHARLAAYGGSYAQMPQALGVPLAKALGRLPVLTTLADGSISLAEAAASLKRWGRITWTGEPVYMGVALLEDEPTLLLTTPDVDRLAGLFGPVVVEVSAQLEAAELRRRRRARWLSQPSTATLEDAAFWLRQAFDEEGIQGEIGLRVAGAATTRLNLVLRDHAYAQRRVDVGLPGLEIVLAAPLKPDDTCTWFKLSQHARRAMRVVAATIERFYAALAAVPDAPLRAWFELRWAGDWHAALRAVFDWPEGAVLPPSIKAAPPLVVGPLAEIPLIRTTRGVDDRATVTELRARRALKGTLPWITAVHRALPRLHPWLLRLDDADTLLMEALFAPDLLVRSEDLYAEHVARAVFYEQAPTGPVLRGMVCTVPIDQGGITGEVGFTADQEGALRAQGPASKVHLFYEGRRIDTLQLFTGIGPFTAAITVEGEGPNDAWSGVNRSSALGHRIAQAIAGRLPALLAQVVQQDSAHAVAFARAFVDVLYPFLELRDVADLLRQRHGAADADRRYRALMERVWSLGRAAVPRVRAIIASGALPTALTLEGRHDARRVALMWRLVGPALTEPHERLPLLRLVEGVPGLAGAPALQSPSRRWHSLGALVAALAEGTPIVGCPDGTPRESERVDVVFVDPEAEAFAHRLLGTRRLKTLADWTRETQLRRVYEARPMRALALQSGRTCVIWALPDGVMGLSHPHPARGASHIQLLVGGRLIETLEPTLPTRVRAMINVDDATLSLTSGFLRVDRETKAQALERVIRYIPALISQLGSDWPLHTDRAWSARHHVLEAIARDPEAPTLSGLSILPRLGEGPVTLLGLRRHLKQNKPVCVCAPHHPAGGFDDESIWVLVLPDSLRARLEALVGELEDYATRWAAVTERRAFEKRSTVEARLDGARRLLARQAIGWRGLSGEVGLLHHAEGHPFELNGHALPTQVLYQGRPLCIVELWSPLRGLVAVVESEDLQPNATFDGVLDSAPLERIQRALNAAARKMPYRSRVAVQRTLGPLVLDLVRLTFPSPTFRRAYDHLRTHLAAERADATYDAILHQARGGDMLTAESMLRSALNSDQPIDGETLVSLAQRPDAAQRSEIINRLSGRPLAGQAKTDAAERVVGSLPGAAKIPVAELSDGTPVTLAEILAQVDEDGLVVYGPGSTTPGLLHLGRGLHVGLRCLLGADLQSVAHWKVGHRQAALIASLPPLPQLEAPVQRPLHNGQVGLSLDPALWGLHVGVGGHRVARLPLPGPLPLVMVLDHEALPLRWSGEVLEGVQDAAPLLAQADQAARTVVAAFAAQAQKLTHAERAGFYPAAVQALAEWVPGGGGDPSLVPGRLQPLLEIAGLRGIDGQSLSLQRLKRAGDKPIWVVGSGEGPVRHMPGVMVCADPPLQRALRTLFPKVVDGADRLTRRKLALRVRRERPLPAPPSDAWAVEHLERGALRGVVWVPRGDRHTVSLGSDGGEVCQQSAADVAPLPFCAALFGRSVSADPFQPRAELTVAGHKVLLRALNTLFDQLIERYEQGAVPADEVHALEGRLQRLAVHAQRSAEAEPEGVFRIARALQSLRLFAVPEQGQRSMLELLEHQPPAWSHLGLWPPPTPSEVGEPVRPASPTPVSPAVAQSPEAALLEQLRGYLRRIRDHDAEIFTDVALSRLHVSRGAGTQPVRINPRGVHFDATHPFIARRIERPTPEAMAVLASLAFGALVEGHPREAEVEAMFMRRLVARVAGDLTGRGTKSGLSS